MRTKGRWRGVVGAACQLNCNASPWGQTQIRNTKLKGRHINIMQIMMFAHWNNDVHVFSIYKRQNTHAHAQINKADRKCNLLGAFCLAFSMPQNGSHCGAVAHEGCNCCCSCCPNWWYVPPCAPRKMSTLFPSTGNSVDSIA